MCFQVIVSLLMTDIFPSPEVLINDVHETGFEKLSREEFTTLQITPADTDLWLKMGQLRGEVYADRKYISLDDLNEDGAEYDDYDAQSEHFIAVDSEGEVIGTVRVINRGDTGLVLPAESEFETTLPEQAQEISRLIHSSDLSATEGMLVSLALMRATLKATSGVSENIYAVLEKKLHRQLSHHIGIQLRTVGEERQIEKYNGTTNYLVEMQPILITSQIHQRDMRVMHEIEGHASLAESILGKPFAPFFERDAAAKGLGKVSLSDLTSPNPEQYDRNRGFYSKEEQEKLWESTVAIAGAGGDGGQLAIALARSGVRKFKLADPEIFEVQNLNRQAGASYATLGHNKAEVIARELRAIGATVEVYNMGITEENVDEFVAGSDLIIDETEFTMPELGVMLARRAREHQLPVLMALNIGFGSYTTSFAHDGMKFEEYLGLDPEMSLGEIAKQEVSIAKWAPHIPTYANTDVLVKVQKGEMSAPTVVQGVLFAAADAGTQAVMHLLSDVNPERAKWVRWAPHGRSIDSHDGTHEVSSRFARFNISVAIAALRTRLGKNQPTDR